MRTGRRSAGAVAAVTAALVLAACGGGAGKAGPGGTTTTAGGGTTGPQSTALGQGVTADAINLGVVIINYDSIKDFIDFTRGDQQRTYQVFVDDLNKRGGVGGRRIVPFYDEYIPVGSVGPTQACTKLTQDDHAFATIGVLIDFTGSAQLCFTKNQRTVLVTHELSQEEIGQAPPGLLLTPDITADRRLNVLMALVKQRGTLKGKKVAILAETGTQNRIAATIKPALDRLGVQQGTPAVVTTGANPDTAAAQAQLDSFIERWKTEGVDAVVISGLDIVSKQFVAKLRAGLPGALLLTDAHSSAKEAAQDIVRAGQKPNPYDGMLTANGLSDEQTFETPSVQRCVQVYEQATGEKVVAPKDLKAGPDGKRAEIYQAVEDACGELTFFALIAGKVGKYLNVDNWTATVDGLGNLNGQVVGQRFSSLGKGKYDAQNDFALAQFDSTFGEGGDFRNITPITDTAGLRP